MEFLKRIPKLLSILLALGIFVFSGPSRAALEGDWESSGAPIIEEPILECRGSGIRVTVFEYSETQHYIEVDDESFDVQRLETQLDQKNRLRVEYRATETDLSLSYLSTTCNGKSKPRRIKALLTRTDKSGKMISTKLRCRPAKH